MEQLVTACLELGVFVVVLFCGFVFFSRKSAHTVLTDAKPQDKEHVQLCHTPHTRPCCSIVVLRVDDHGAGAALVILSLGGVLGDVVLS